MSEQNAEVKPEIRMPFVYSFCNDIEAVRNFYVKLLGMTEKSYQNTEEFGWLNIDGGGFEFMYFRTPDPVPERGFAGQPGDGGGDGLHTSWSVAIPEDDFEATYERLREARVRAMTETPTWRQDCYWGYTVMDPAGNTVEVYTTPKERPASTDWPGK
jgi:catechol 2,3-dioxygenase-like lactoylglutathione lyase family enzyme